VLDSWATAGGWVEADPGDGAGGLEGRGELAPEPDDLSPLLTCA
jgi:hypothetical protein